MKGENKGEGVMEERKRSKERQKKYIESVTPL